MFRLTYTARLTRLPKLRDLQPRAVKALETRLTQNVVPRVIQDLPIISAYPGAALYPFQFATDASRRYYFWRYRDRLPYTRTMALANDWSVVASGQLGGGVFSTFTALASGQRIGGTLTITVFNAAPEATYVYGPRQVPGHANTGWGEQLENNRAAFLGRVADYVTEEWKGAVEEAIEN